jgi:hypothetical protein
MPQIFMPGLFDSFNPSGQPISKTPAINKDSQYMLSLELIELAMLPVSSVAEKSGL